MLRSLLSSAIIFSSLAVQAQIAVQYPKVNPIVLTFSSPSLNLGGGTYILTANGSGNSRITLRMFGPGYLPAYTYSNGLNETDMVMLPSSDAEDLLRLAKNASQKCPLGISLDRASFKINKITSPCDPLGPN